MMLAAWGNAAREFSPARRDLILPVICLNACTKLPLGSSLTGRCEEICASVAGVLSPPCQKSIENWAIDESYAELSSQATFASANVAGWFGQLMALSKIQNDTLTAQNMVAKGFLKDFGKYDQCQAIVGTHYCHSDIGTTAFNTGPMSLGLLALCLPETCSSRELTSVWHILLRVIKADSEFSIVSKCGDQSVAWDDGATIMLILCIMVVLLVVFATAASHYRTSQIPAADPESGYLAMERGPSRSLVARLLHCFALQNNLKHFWNIRTGTSTSCLDGVRTMSMMWVVFGHTLLWPFDADLPGYNNIGDIVPFYNRRALIGTWTGQAVLSAEFSVDSFFFMSGFLATYIGIKKLAGKGVSTPLRASPFMYLDRFLRLTPTYFFIILCYTYLSPLLSSGPFWGILDHDKCKSNWWQNLLYVQTLFIKTDDENSCYGVSWYLADDMMFFYMVPFIIALALWRRLYCYVALGCAICASIIYSLAIAAEFQLSPSPFDPTGMLYMGKYYYPPWTRAPAYLIGAALGIAWRDCSTPATAVLQDLRAQCALWLLSASILGSCMWGNWDQLQSVPSELSQSPVRAVAFVALAKPAWAMGLGTLCILCFARVGGLVQWFLERELFGYLSKLTFTVYLLHPTVLFVYVRTLTAPIEYTALNFAFTFVAVLTVTTALALLVHLFVEQPTANLTSLLFTPSSPSKCPGKGDPAWSGSSADMQLSDSSSGLLMLTLPLPFEGESSHSSLPLAQMLALPPPPALAGLHSQQLNAPLSGTEADDPAMSQITSVNVRCA